jgi:hypothetical protein
MTLIIPGAVTMILNGREKILIWKALCGRPRRISDYNIEINLRKIGC